MSESGTHWHPALCWTISQTELEDQPLGLALPPSCRNRISNLEVYLQKQIIQMVGKIDILYYGQEWAI